MIDYLKSAELNGCSVEDLKSRFKKYPHSNKRIVRICDGCGEEREVTFDAYTDLCHKCANTNPEKGEFHSKWLKQYHIDHPEAAESARLKAVEQWSNPEAREAARLRGIEQWSDPEVRDEMSMIKKQFFIDNPEVAESHSEFMIRRFSDQVERDDQRNRLLQYHKDNPAAAEVARLKGIERFSTQESRNEISEVMKNSIAHKIAAEDQKGGNYLVWHHIAYDFRRLEAFRVRITNSFHGSIHHPPGIPISRRGYSLID